MMYNKIYNKLIEKSRSRILKGYSEKHHVIPKCLGGNNSKENLVRLTAREHFVAHRLLCKIYPTEGKLKNALWRFIHGNKHQKILVNSRTYEVIKKECRKVWSIQSKQRMADPEYRAKTYGKGHSKESRLKANKTMESIRKTDEYKNKKKQSAILMWRQSRELIPVKAYKAIQVQKANKGRKAIWIKGELVGQFEYAKQASQVTGVAETKISKVILGIRKQSNGFIFERVTNGK